MWSVLNVQSSESVSFDHNIALSGENIKKKVGVDVGVVVTGKEGLDDLGRVRWKRRKVQAQVSGTPRLVFLLNLDGAPGHHPTSCDASHFFWVPTFIHAFPAAQASLPVINIGQNLMYLRFRPNDTSENLFPSSCQH